VIEPVLAALVVQRVERQPVGAGRKQPPQPTSDAGAGLVEMRDRRIDDPAVNLVEEPLKVLGAAGDERGQRPGRDRRAQPLAKQLGGALIGQVLTSDQVDPQRADARPVLRRRHHALGKRGRRQVPATTAAALGNVLDDAQADRRQIEHLPALLARDRRRGQLAAAARARRGRVREDLVGLGDLRQMPAAVPGLTARLASRRAPEALLHRRLGQPV